MAGSDCPHMGTCEMYSLFRGAGLLETWKMGYCRGGYQRCARYQLTRENRPVPINLLPNGVRLQHAGRDKHAE